MSYLKKVSSAMYDPDHDLVFEIVGDADKEIAELKANNERLLMYCETRDDEIRKLRDES